MYYRKHVSTDILERMAITKLKPIYFVVKILRLYDSPAHQVEDLFMANEKTLCNYGLPALGIIQGSH